MSATSHCSFICYGWLSLQPKYEIYCLEVELYKVYPKTFTAFLTALKTFHFVEFNLLCSIPYLRFILSNKLFGVPCHVYPQWWTQLLSSPDTLSCAFENLSLKSWFIQDYVWNQFCLRDCIDSEKYGSCYL